MTLRQRVKHLGRRRRVRGITVSDVISITGASRQSASAALSETLERTERTRKGTKGRLNSVYAYMPPYHGW